MLHVVGLPHTPFDSVEASACAFTAKSVRLTWMLREIGRDFTVYWGGDKTPEPVNFVSILSTAQQEAFFGKYDPAELPVIHWELSRTYWQQFNNGVIQAIRERIQPGDWILLTGGAIHQPIVDAFPEYLCIEPGVGYGGICNRTFACFESYAWMHNRYGEYHIGDGRAFDAVIGNAVDPNEFTPGESHGYALFVGRLIHRKAPMFAAEIANKAGLKLKIAGAGMAHYEPGLLVATDGTRIEGDIDYVGVVHAEERSALYRHAEVLIVPTLYIGPWEGVHAEALMSDVGVVAPDYGVFTETLDRGFRYRYLSEALQCVERARSHRGQGIFRSRAIRDFSLETCTKQYAEWFDRLDLLKGKGFYA